jgi:hypothetical protein
MNETDFKRLFPNASKATVAANVDYVTPSLNRTIRQHWAEQLREKKKGWTALSSALKAIGSDPSIPITLRQVAKACSTALDTHISFAVMSRGESFFKLSRKEFRALAKSAQK